MLTVLNSLANGYVAAVIIDACRRWGVFVALDGRDWVTLPTLARQLQASAGPLRVALHMLQCLGWLHHQRDRDGADCFRLTAMANPAAVLDGISELYQAAPDACIDSPACQALMTRWLRSLGSATDMDAEQPDGLAGVDLQAGPVLLPLLLSLYHQGHDLNEQMPLWASLPDALRDAILSVFLASSHGYDKRYIFLNRNIIEAASPPPSRALPITPPENLKMSDKESNTNPIPSPIDCSVKV